MSPGSRTPDRFPPKSRALRVPLRPPSVCRAWVRVAAVCAPERAPLTPLHLLCLGVSADSTRGFAAARVQEGERARRAPGKREEVAPGVRAGPVVSRPGRWELSCGINCLFVSGWEVDPPPPPPPIQLWSTAGPALTVLASTSHLPPSQHLLIPHADHDLPVDSFLISG